MLRVLVVDDEEIQLRATSAGLRRAGLEVDTALGGDQALERVEANAYDVVLADLMMPRMNGIELVRRIHAARPGTRVVLTSSFPLAPGQIERMGLTWLEFIAKTRPLPELVALLTRPSTPAPSAANDAGRRSSPPEPAGTPRLHKA